MQGNGKGYCANSRSRPLLCQGDSGQTCLLCGRIKGGERGCWARGCRSGEAPESLTEHALRNRVSNVRAAQRESARKHNAERLAREAQEAADLQKKAGEAQRAGLRSCLRAPGLKRALEYPTERSVGWGCVPLNKKSAHARAAFARQNPFLEDLLTPASEAVPKKAYGTAELRKTLWWEEAGKTVECDRCGVRFKREEVRLQREPGRSRFCNIVGWCKECRAQDRLLAQRKIKKTTREKIIESAHTHTRGKPGRAGPARRRGQRPSNCGGLRSGLRTNRLLLVASGFFGELVSGARRRSLVRKLCPVPGARCWCKEQR